MIPFQLTAAPSHLTNNIIRISISGSPDSLCLNGQRQGILLQLVKIIVHVSIVGGYLHTSCVNDEDSVLGVLVVLVW